MAQTNPTDTSSSADAQDLANKEQMTSVVQSPAEVTPPAPGITSAQAEQIISQLKSLKQNLFILTLIGGFFALRAILFHR